MTGIRLNKDSSSVNMCAWEGNFRVLRGRLVIHTATIGRFFLGMRMVEKTKHAQLDGIANHRCIENALRRMPGGCRGSSAHSGDAKNAHGSASGDAQA